MEAGDVLVFTEALMHGTLPWKGTHTRRTLLFRFGPATCAYARGYLCSPAEIAKLNLSETAKEMLLPPYHSRYDRAVASQRSEEQLDYDRKLVPSYLGEQCYLLYLCIRAILVKASG
ncbi:hypothetical protein Pmar_PMAR018333 [Perkinsus marinus ATCC 50983]|uniref:Phytanoyl-CoA dioxygenase family protein n=1 Tax=Perkinsus marinus (strain ATCC 50983 / TXsc) TaxID=423536 RepID=C5LVT9_PERM5|nr:hypothetical protein Pmar_PMAR018333 [Perkinsus marinus ATCC 50983]EEQ99212.1 hypothetical protein Pmar_PMAR018333 [Perkinsus marinus ATCC 50983]|eukprot:XP_002766495.1 hypothetical protein Pmar_PMAR018333 [Perkinsus marinus ATCC 50983]